MMEGKARQKLTKQARDERVFALDRTKTRSAKAAAAHGASSCIHPLLSNHGNLGV